MRKTELSHDDLKKKAVLEAERLAQTGGLAAISMRPVAKAAQCSPGTLHINWRSGRAGVAGECAYY